MAAIQINVKPPSGKTFQVTIPKDYYVEDLQFIIYEVAKISTVGIPLYLDGKELEEGHFLSEYNIQPGSTVLIKQ
ncbi:MAG: hypothetical protein EZS28_011201 [Streblomastix strix]|uniref:Ubiquitin-like domain-containing protein n=1 Tax=Streblomastix strix TaxID=222440 RepID=A0A5J4WED8_9EUKA|nr:MAG: hypothetical protein EZS28_011201 [Streblomastix strix]